MRRYETVFVLRPSLAADQTEALVKRFPEILAGNGAELFELDRWGVRDLAYRIKSDSRGYFVRLDYAGSGAAVAELERNLKLADDVLRYLTVLVDRDVDPAAVRSQIEASRKAAPAAKEEPQAPGGPAQEPSASGQAHTEAAAEAPIAGAESGERQS
ncbi:MAG: 30S ribosomal protein S6 [Deltaproteobacteria bacterium]|nr:30S ribosomal protein S6 [Deltaproteobacteria bacterium]